jgi:hypothetical protein
MHIFGGVTSRLRRSFAPGGFAVALLGCGGSSGTTGTIAPTAMTAVSSGITSGTVGQSIADRPSVKVTSSSGGGVAGVSVTFAVVSGGGSQSGGSTTTDASGIATVGSWTLGTIAGTNAMTATAPGVASVAFTATAVAGAATTLVKLEGDGQSAAPGSAVLTSPSVRAADQYGNPVGFLSVVFAVASGGGTLTGPNQLTSSNGTAAAGVWTLGPALGANTLTATAPGLTPVTFTATGKVQTLSTIGPRIAAAAPGSSVSFAARDDAGSPPAVIWRVNGIAGGNAQLGVISALGRYDAPSTIPAGDSVVVSAVLANDPATQRSATVFFVPSLGGVEYFTRLPRVVDAAHPTATRVLLLQPDDEIAVTFIPNSGGPISLLPIGNNVFTMEIPATTSLSGYIPGTLHNFIGRLDYRGPQGNQIKLVNFTVAVRDATMPDVAITPLGTDAQRSAHVLNLRADTASINPWPEVVANALTRLGGDRFDFVAVIATVSTTTNRSYSGVRNDIRGIGTQVFDNSAAWGGRGRLRGVISFPIDDFFDGAEAGFIHEVGHSWINFATDAVLRPGVPHWPASTMASGVMGFSIGGSNVGGQFPWSLTPLGNGTVRINRVPFSDHFTPLDLYLMGLLPADSVPTMYVLPLSANPGTFVDGMTSAAVTYTILDYITGQGTRVPTSTTSSRQFAVAVVVLSYGRLLTPAEMAFYDAASARAETTTSLRSSSGLVVVDASGFFLATGGRATLTTRLP